MAVSDDVWAKLTPEERHGAEVPPPASAEALSRWEAKYGVTLPGTLARALLIQDGGIVRDTGFQLILQSVDFIVPLTASRWANVDDEEDGRLVADRSKHFVIGDHSGLGVVLDFNVGPEPRVLHLWYGMGDLLQDDDDGTFDQMLRSAWERHEQSDRVETDEE